VSDLTVTVFFILEETMQRLKGKILVKHRKGCYAVAAVKEGKWDTVWSVSDGTGLVGGEKRKQLAQVFRCNDIECPAEIGIKMKDMWSVLPIY
jgi:hypothetical protein